MSGNRHIYYLHTTKSIMYILRVLTWWGARRYNIIMWYQKLYHACWYWYTMWFWPSPSPYIYRLEAKECMYLELRRNLYGAVSVTCAPLLLFDRYIESQCLSDNIWMTHWKRFESMDTRIMMLLQNKFLRSTKNGVAVSRNIIPIFLIKYSNSIQLFHCGLKLCSTVTRHIT